MDGSRFDQLARGVASASSRRTLLRSALGFVLGGAFASVGPESASAAALRKPGEVCREHANCASGRCGPRDRTGRRQCLCSAADQCPQPTRRQPCHEAVCSPEGVCGLAVAVGKACDDKDRCTESSTCQADGSCAGVPKDCSAEPCATIVCDGPEGPCYDTGKECDPAEVCTVGVCDPETGACIRVPKTCDGPVDPVCGAETCHPPSGLCLYVTSTICPQNDNPCNQVFCRPGVNPQSGVCGTATIQCPTDDPCIQDKQCVPDGFDVGGFPQFRCVYTPYNCVQTPCPVGTCVNNQCVCSGT